MRGAGAALIPCPGRAAVQRSSVGIDAPVTVKTTREEKKSGASAAQPSRERERKEKSSEHGDGGAVCAVLYVPSCVV
jgi:hypothetical protein